MAQVICQYCDKKFYAKPYWLKRGWGKYCSRKCRDIGVRKGKGMPCYICGRVAYKSPKDLERSKSGLFFCGKSCQTRWRNQVYVGEKHGNFTTGVTSYRNAIERHKVPKICVLCETKDHRVLAVHHIDKNRKNNKIENLAWLCHNCHYLVHHFDIEREKFMATIV